MRPSLKGGTVLLLFATPALLFYQFTVSLEVEDDHGPVRDDRTVIAIVSALKIPGFF
jgi:hypothetical protein